MYLYRTSFALRELFNALINKLADPKWEPTTDSSPEAYVAIKDKDGNILSYEALPVETESVTLDDLLILRNKLCDHHNGARAPWIDRRTMEAIGKLEAALRQNKPLRADYVRKVSSIRTYS